MNSWFVFSLVLFSLVSGADHISLKDYKELQAVLDGLLREFSEHYNTSLSYAVRSEKLEPFGGFITSTYGFADIVKQTPLTPSSIIPGGSVTKTVTAIGLYKLVEQGLLQMDDKIAPIVDPLLTSENGTTLMELFQDPRINDITVHHLVSMRSGLQDYDDSVLQSIQFNGGEYTPYDLLWMINKTLLCDPGECGQYSTTGFNLAGLVATAALGLSSWKDLNQHDQFLGPMFRETIFPIEGPCTDFLDQGIVHQVGMTNMEVNKAKTHYEFTWEDITKYSCGNAWTGGNIVAAPRDTALMYEQLFKGNLISLEHANKMKECQPIGIGGTEFGYGEGIMACDLNDFGHPDENAWHYGYGHGGEDYGSSLFGLYFPKVGFAAAIGMPSEFGLNCSLPNFQDNQGAMYSSFCFALNHTGYYLNPEEWTPMTCGLPKNEEPTVALTELFPSLHPHQRKKRFGYDCIWEL